LYDRLLTWKFRSRIPLLIAAYVYRYMRGLSRRHLGAN